MCCRVRSEGQQKRWRNTLRKGGNTAEFSVSDVKKEEIKDFNTKTQWSMKANRGPIALDNYFICGLDCLSTAVTESKLWENEATLTKV